MTETQAWVTIGLWVATFCILAPGVAILVLQSISRLRLAHRLGRRWLDRHYGGRKRRLNPFHDPRWHGTSGPFHEGPGWGGEPPDKTAPKGDA